MSGASLLLSCRFYWTVSGHSRRKPLSQAEESALILLRLVHYAAASRRSVVRPLNTFIT